MEIKDGQFTDAHGIIFKKVGPDLCVVDRGFDTIPVQALAVSNKYGLTFFVHSYGFCVARTSDLVEASEESIDSPKNECNAQERSLASVRLPNIRMLALSTDDLTIAACVEKEIHFYNVPILVQKGNKKDHIDISPLKSISIREENHCIRTFIWHPTKKDTFMTLSTSGKLTNGRVATDLKTIADGVEAADWSPDGQFVGYITGDRSLCIVSTDSSMSSSFKLPSEMFDEASDDGSEAHVDMVKWVRLDSMLISCVHMDADGQEDDYLVFLLVSSKGHFAKDQNMSELFFFEQFFPTIDASILPSESGPYMLVNQIKSWEVIVATNRRSIDNHISLLGWLQEGAGSEACKFELVDDRHTPRIELQASDEDNTVVGLAIDHTTGSIRLPTPDGDSGETLPPGPLLLCMTLEGKLTLFSLARTGSSWARVDVVSTPAEVPKQDVGPFSSGVTDKTSMKVSLDTAETVPEVAKWSPLGEVGVRSKDGTSNMPGPLNRRKDADNLVRPAGTGGYIEQKQVLRSGASEMEMDFVKELEKVQRMAEEVNELMAFIEGRSADAKTEHKKVFTKFVLEDIEYGIQNLSTECRNWQVGLVEQRQSISDLCDESMQVDAWRIYVQSLFEQASDCRYQDLRNKQKLHPEMDAMRKRILKVDQSLKQQIAELEEHLHNLELSRRGRMRNQSKNQAISALHNAENFHWLQSLYSTVNTQLGAAEQLAQLLTLQMETLNISLMSKDDVNRLVNTSASKLQNIVLEEQSLTKDSNVFSRSKATLREAGVLSPFKTTMNYAPQTPTKPDTGGTNVGQPDSTRRRRHSVDRLWVDAGAAKTTVKRAAPIGHSEGIFASPKREFRQMEAQQSSRLPGMCATESNIPSFQLSLSRASSASVSMPTVGAEKIISKPVMGGSLGKPAIRSPFDGQAEQTHSSKSSAASSRSITTHAAAPTMSNASLKFSIPTSGSGLNISTAAISSPQLSFSLTSKPSTVSSTTNLLASQDNFMFGMKAKTSGSMDSTLKPGGLSPSSSSKRSLAVGPLTSTSSTAQPPGMQRIGVRAKEDSEVLPSGSHSMMFQSMIPGDLQAKITMAQMADSLKAENSSTTEKPEALESTDNASSLPSKVGFQDSTGLMAGARGDKFSSISSKAIPHTSTVISTKSLQESTVPPVPTEKPSIGLLSGAQAGTDMSPVNSFSSSGSDPVTTLSSFPTTVQSLGTSVSSTVSPFVGSTSALFSPSIPKSTVATDLSKFESASFKAGSSTAPSSVPSTVKAATLFGEGITPSSHQVFPPASNVCPPASSATGAAAITFSENVTATPQHVFSPAANASASASPSSFPFRGPPTMSDEEDMEEEASNAIDSGFSSFGGFGLGSSAPSAGLQKANPFGGSPFVGQANSATVLSVPSGQLFKPAAFSLPTLQSSPSQSNENTFGTTFSSGIGSGFMTGISGFGSPAQPAVSAFGQTAQPGHGQQALGSALGTFGQTRQIGTPFGASATPGAGLGFATSGGFANAATGGGFASAASGGGFGSAPTGGGFAGFSSSGGFGGASGGVGGGFQSFSGNQGGFGTFSGGPSGFGGNANSSLFTQMRK